MQNLLKELCEISGVSGNEQNISKFIKDKLSAFANVYVQHDNSVLVSIGPEKAEKNIMFEAHMDQIGMIVTSIEKNGFVKFSSCGGVNAKLLYGKNVNIHGKTDLVGVVCSVPPHLQKDKNKNSLNIDDMFIDLGMSKEDAEKIISSGDRISFANKFYTLANNNFASPSMDNRCGVCILMKLVEKLSKETLNTKFTILFSSREEVGCRGAKISTYRCNPNEAICLDVDFAKQPEVHSDKYSTLGSGAIIGIYPSLPKNIPETLIEISKTQTIPYQIAVDGSGSGTNADVISISRSGIPCGVVSIPQRYMHSGVEVVNLNDMQNILDLIFNYAKQGGTKTWN